jgi:hypothetical protein
LDLKPGMLLHIYLLVEPMPRKHERTSSVDILKLKQDISTLLVQPHEVTSNWGPRLYYCTGLARLVYASGVVTDPGYTLAPRKGPSVPTVQEAGWAPEPVWTQKLEEKSFCPCQESNLDRSVVQPVARHYTDWATWLTDVYEALAEFWQYKIKVFRETCLQCHFVKHKSYLDLHKGLHGNVWTFNHETATVWQNKELVIHFMCVDMLLSTAISPVDETNRTYAEGLRPHISSK